VTDKLNHDSDYENDTFEREDKELHLSPKKVSKPDKP
jgi:hypothetical protein